MAQVTKADILLQVPLPDLQEKFFEHYNSLSYVPELFELIDIDKLCAWLVNQFTRDFTLNELKEIFDYEEEIRS